MHRFAAAALLAGSAALGWLGVPGAAPAETPAPLALTGARIRKADGSLAVRTLHTAAGRIRAIDTEAPASRETRIALDGATLVPAFIDSHVHLTLADPSAELLGGVAAAVDFGSPVGFWDQTAALAPLRVLAVGPFLIAPGGYPSLDWGADGYGRTLNSVAEARTAVAEVAAHGGPAVKLAYAKEAGPLLAPELRQAIVSEAHARGLRVGAHALRAEMAALAVADGVDLLVHAPREPLDEATVRSLCARRNAAVIPTLTAFHAASEAVENLRRLRSAGCTVLYGTDLPNHVSEGILVGELRLLVQAGLSPAEAVAAATSVPAGYWHLDDLGVLLPGKAASLLAIEGDPDADLSGLATPRAVVMAGARIR